ncbi:oligosaccharide flippase family protein [Aquabacterium humicola]|uniref:oligosaccharide flippase family protein n=1 Tax=Aquabacterium humicola TaxID=3237377 RepID=UPI002542FAB0|nr:oligosaccharide flippase family protein [Rubrivivax pictus]
MAAAGLLRATLTLLTGGALAQALPLLLGPWLARLYSPQEFGIYHLFAAVAANIAVVACARYEFALPLAADAREADALRRLGLVLLAGATVLCALGAALWAWMGAASWPLWLPLSVAVLGALSLATLWATRGQRFRALAGARVLQHGGGAAAQVAAGVAQGGVHGLIAAPIAAALAALALLRLPLGRGASTGSADELKAAARRHREFPLLNTPHAFLGALQDTLTMALITAQLGAAAGGAWGLALRYLKAPATLVGGALSQALYPRLASAGGITAEARHTVRRAMLALAAIAAPLVLLLWIFGPDLFAWAFGERWREAGELARALALYIGVHFVASPLAVVTMAWGAQAWALKLALIGQGAFLAALALGLQLGSLAAAGWAVSIATAAYFGWYFFKLATWPVAPVAPEAGA